jgi:2,2-dialkylglycine decarboxylase (pyruvate)
VASESEWLERARRWCFRARLEGAHWDGPVFERGEGSLLWDVEGREYLDLNSGQICGVLGHSHPRIAEAVAEAARKLIHASAHYYNTAEIELAERLGMTLPDSLDRAFFGLSGSDATEAAMGVAKAATGRYEIASPHVSFHGFSELPRALSFAIWGERHAPPAPGNFALMAPYCFRCPIRHSFPDCDIACLEGSLAVLDTETAGSLAAIITEPLHSAGGVIVPPEGWLARVKAACEERGALLILDESQTGLAKLGTMWGFEHDGVVPDIVTVSKHFGGGIPISAVVTTSEVEERAIDSGFVYAHSHSADPLGCTAAIATLDVIEQDGLVARSDELGRYWRARLAELADEHEEIVDIRGRGVLQGIELGAADGSPGGELGHAVGKSCLEAGLLFSVRRSGSVFRFTIPFSTTEQQLDRAAAILDDAFVRARAVRATA